MKKAVYKRALQIASEIMAMEGLCIEKQDTPCTHTRLLEEGNCGECIMWFFVSKAEEELKRGAKK